MSVKSIGFAKKILREAIPDIDRETSVMFELLHKKGKKETKKGTLTFLGTISSASETASPPEKEVDDSAAKAPHKVKEATDKALKKSAASEEPPSEPLIEDSVVAMEGNTVDRPVKKNKKGGNVSEKVPVEALPSGSGGGGAMQFVVESIQIRDVKNTGGMFDGQDPAVTITLGEQKKATKRYSPLYFTNTLKLYLYL